MDTQAVINKLLSILPQVLILALAGIGALWLSYVIYRKKGGKRSFSPIQIITIFLLIMWFGTVMVLTMFSRGANFEGWINVRLFSGYKSAWYQWSLSEFQLIIFNMLMFVPLGFLMPLLGMKTRRFMPVFFISLAVTIGIELSQMLSRRGIFELDDILHNTLGSLAGYFIMRAIQDSIKQRKLAFKATGLALCIPLIFCLLFTGALAVYHAKEFGNLSIRPAIKQDLRRVEVELAVKLPDEAEPVSLYVNDKIYNPWVGKKMAQVVGESFGLQLEDGNRIEGMNRTWSFTDTSGSRYVFSYSLLDGGWQLYNEAGESVTMSEEEAGKHREFYESWMQSNDILPAEAVFSIQNGNMLRWDMRHSVAAIAQEEKDFENGLIMLTPSPNGRKTPHDFKYFMQENKYVRKVDVISPAQAYEEVLRGNFYMFTNLKKKDLLRIEQYELAYTYDSKGYYQPVYRFIGTVNGEPWETLIPAI
ncbi:Glycopeptide antibiotics resistance protein [Paenibacillus sp. UNCCL117]|uniref:VanZ family protein n=1 Tax=unclassified Paenibacillus TaxID=185978 RepID=UPI0008869F88|nr:MULTISPECIES: VanZ family protein [unclassified Paenibacillus]SDD85052.1 Glycopeptide antibiotics resistance protein [Paenibacillus sp. cl123]SFW54466.1 Glycopeptide antibiotics resistance protein [Paenibacillus sp. UNCCL117]